jgi:dipeptidyl aminopeptidase/acylaminoacyl peptidase
MKNVILSILVVITFTLIGWFANVAYRLPKNSNPLSQIKPTPLNKYTIENLAQTTFKSSQIEIGKVLKENSKSTSYEFSMKFSPDFSDNLKTTSGVINIPKGAGPFPVIVMFRGYVDQKQYLIGEGTQPSATIFAQNGFITVAPDFLGYGDSDPETNDIFEARFQTYVTAATILKSITDPAFAKATAGKWDGKNIFIWGHSNGGQIALTTLEITGVTYPTVLWAPVSMPFPGSILYYAYEADDQGRYIVSHLADFNNIYDTSKFSLTNYLNLIKAPILLNQGTADTEVPYWISDSLVKTLESDGVTISYIKYPGANHNLTPAWDKAIQNSLNFFKSHLK